MPVDVLPLFRPDVLAPRVAAFALPPAADAFQARLGRWADLLGTSVGGQYKETELLADFLTDVFVDGLGYRPPVARDAVGAYTFSREAWVEADGKFADAVLGRFTAEQRDYVIAVEGKGPRDPLDRPFAGRRVSAVDQAYRYAINLPCDWAVVTNLHEVRLYHKGSTQRTYERFDIAELATDRRALARFVYVLGAERVTPSHGRSHLHELLAESTAAGERLTQAFYAEYANLRREVLAAFRRDNPGVAPDAVLAATQTLLDRVLFLAFAEDRGLVPAHTLGQAFAHRDPYHPRPVWENFRGLFRAVDQGSAALNVPRYNGGLFAHDAVLDGELAVSDAVCERVAALGRYDYRVPGTVPPDAAGVVPPLVDVEILGHIFEQSISDLEALRASLAAPVPAAPTNGHEPGGNAPARDVPAAGRGSGGGIAGAAASRRRREGAFYTQRFVTRYLVQQALGPVLDRRFEALRVRQNAIASGTAVAALADPKAYVVGDLNRPQRAALVGFWEAWLAELQTVRVLDPACGSGAFLIEAFDQLHTQYARTTDTLEELRPQGLGLFDPDRTILQENLFGVDLNAEAVDIARLSVWVKTAQRGKVLTDLDRNVRVGNSVVGDVALDARAFDWGTFGAPLGGTSGGVADCAGIPVSGLFDVVVGNPPYVRAELLGPYKRHWERRFATYHGSADLYVYFYELGLRLLKPGGRLAYVVTNKWLKAGYAEALRRYLADEVWLDEVVDLGHARQVFPDADVFPSLLVAERPVEGATAPTDVRVAVIPREVLRPEELPAQVMTGAFPIARARFGGSPWTLDPPEADGMMRRLQGAGPSLAEYLGAEPLYGIKTGYNEAFLLSRAERDALVAADPSSGPLLRPYVRGQDVERWTAAWDSRWLLVLRSSADHAWPWRDAGDAAETVFAATYPAIYAHMKLHEAPLRQRSDQGRYWWELRPCSYYDRFDAPKILYQVIQFYPAYAVDAQGLYGNDKTFLLPSDDLYLLGVLNSPLVWWHNWRFLGHMKDDALNPAAARLRVLPIALPNDKLRRGVEGDVRALVDLVDVQRTGRAELLDWLRLEFAVERPGERLGAFDKLAPDDFVAEVRKRRTDRGQFSPAALRRLRDAHRDAAAPLTTGDAEVARRERAISNAVFAAYGLTPAEVALVWRTAPPRMPVAEIVGAP